MFQISALAIQNSDVKLDLIMQMIFVYLLKKYEVESKQLLAGEKNTKDQNIIDIRINFEHRRMNVTK